MSEVCRFFLQGKCRFGSKCRNLHPRDSTDRGYSGYSGRNDRYSDGYGFTHQRGGQGNRFEYFNNSSSWQGRSRGDGRERGYDRGRDFGRGQYEPSSTYRPRGRGNSTSRAEPTSAEDIVQVIREDMEEWAESRMWPFSCYACQKEGSCLPGLSDTAPEELRWRAYQAGGRDAYLEDLRSLSDQAMSVRRELLKVRASDVRTLLSSGTQSGTLSLFSGAPTAPSTLPPTSLFFSPSPSSSSSSSLFPTLQTKTSLLGGSSTVTVNSFGGSPTATASLFGGPSAVTGNLFGALSPGTPSVSSGSIFGNSNSSALATPAVSQNPFQSSPTVDHHQDTVTSSPQKTPTSVVTMVTTQLTPDDLRAFEADHFTLGKIPETPPPPQFIKS